MNVLKQYKSSAGSGKTFTLVLEYLKLVVEQPQRYRHILAITFTNKATEEMKRRIVQALAKLAGPKGAEDKFFPLLKQYLAASGKQHLDIQAQAQKALQLILSDYSRFSVSTIESFFQRVVRAFSRELNAPLAYEVEMEQELVMDAAVKDLMDDIGVEKDVTALFLKFLGRNLEEEKSWAIGQSVKNLGEELLKELLQEAVSSPYAGMPEPARILEVEGELRKITRAFEQEMKAIASKGKKLLLDASLSPDDFAYKKGGPMGYFDKVLEKTPSDWMPTPRVLTALQNPDGFPQPWVSASEKDRGQLERLKEFLSTTKTTALLQEMVDTYEARYAEYVSCELVLQNLYSFGLLGALSNKLADYRQEMQRMLISDTNFLLRSITKGQEAPFIYEKAGVQYQHYLIDEFQDTSDMQWKNLYPLVLEALSAGSGGLIVGDVKQSIYRWRNGNLMLLLREVEEQLRASGHRVESHPLTDNYRTGPAIVAFNNAFFQKAAAFLAERVEYGAEQITQAYDAVAQDPKRSEMQGYVEIALIGQDSQDDRRNWKSVAESLVLERIASLIAEGWAYGDITIMVRRQQEGLEMAALLQGAGIRVSSADSLRLSSHPAVRLLLALLRCLSPAPEALHEAEAAWLYAGLWQNASETALNTLFHQRAGALPEAFRLRREALQRMPVYECLAQLQNIFSHALPKDAYVSGLLEEALAFSKTTDASINGFLQYWDEAGYKRNVAASPDPQAVQIITIHKAKGLEFPVVIVPYADWDFEPKSGELFWVQTEETPFAPLHSFLPVPFSKEKLRASFFAPQAEAEIVRSYLDNLNLLYVAMTRPQARLYLMTLRKSGRAAKAMNCALLINAVLEEKYEALPPDEADVIYLKAGAPEAPLARESVAALNMQQTEAAAMRPWQDIARVRLSAGRYLQHDRDLRAERIAAGELMHAALALLHTRDDVPFALSRLLATGALGVTQAPEFEAELYQVIEHPVAAAWFETGLTVRNEAEILTESGDVLRPDRVILKEDTAIVIDYKTGVEREVYKKQVSSYVKALQKMNYNKVYGFLYYLSGLQVVEVEGA